MKRAMNQDEIADACAALSNQTSAGIPIAAAVEMMARLQPRFRDVWTSIAKETARGTKLSESLTGMWPPAAIAMVKAGEEAGEISSVFEQIEQSVEVRKAAFGVLTKIYYPFFTLIGGVCSSLFFLAFVIPNLIKALTGSGGGNPSFVLRLGIALNAFITTHWALMTTVGTVLGAVLVLWIVSGRAAKDMQSIMLRIPLLQEHAASIFYAVWAKTVATMTSAGIPIMQAIPLSIQSLPDPLQPSVRRIQLAIEKNTSLGTCADPEMVGDDRERLPSYIINAFKVAGETGDLSAELERASPILIKGATRSIEKVIGAMVPLAMAASGMMIVIPLGAYYTELFALVRKIL